MRTTLSVLLIFFPIHFLTQSCAGFATAADKPNIIIFPADDLGYADIGVNGYKDIPTPNIDSIAHSGVRFTEGLRPHERGFDYHFGFLSGARTYLPGKSDSDPRTMINNQTVLIAATSLSILSIWLVMGYGLLISANDLMWDFFQRHPRTKGRNQSTQD